MFITCLVKLYLEVKVCWFVFRVYKTGLAGFVNFENNFFMSKTFSLKYVKSNQQTFNILI